MNPSHRSANVLRTLFWGLSAVEGIACLAVLLSIPRDPKHGLLFGFSAERLALLAAAAALTAIFIILARQGWKNSAWLVNKIEQPILHGKGFYPVLLAACVFLIAGWIIVFQPAGQVSPALLPYFTRFSPLLAWITAISFQAVLFLLIGRFGFQPDKEAISKPALVIFGICIAVFAVLWVLAAGTGLGVRPDGMGWYEPGAPLLAGQMAAAILAVILLTYLEGRLKVSSKNALLLDIVVAALIWASAAGIWMRQPLQVSYFSPEPRAPNNEVYPYSDAAYYTGIAQSVMIGDGYLKGQSVPRPLFILYLAIVQAIQGPKYEGIILAQTLILALFPVVLYFIGRELKNRSLGVMLAGLEIVREVNAIGATADIQVSNSKLIMSELPTALGIALLILLMLIGMRKARWSSPVLFAAGGVLGCIMLIRTQSIIMTAAAAFCLFCGASGSFLKRLKPVLIFALGFILCISPWLTRNYLTYHKVVFDKPDSGDYWKITYSTPFGADSTVGESGSPDTASMTFDPDLTAYFTAAHFMHNEISTLMVLPATFELNSLEHTVPSPSFWLDWDGKLSAEQTVVFILNLVLVAVGISAAWRRARFAGLLPLFLHLVYSLGDAVTRFSGGRFILPVDWIILIYFALGVTAVVTWLAAGLGWKTRPAAAGSSADSLKPVEIAGNWKTAAALGVLILLIGSLPWLAENVVPRRYSDLTQEKVLSKLQAGNLSAEEKAQLETLLRSGSGTAIEGRLLYPRYYRTEAGEPGQNWYAYSSLPFRRMGFIVVGNNGMTQVVLPVETPPAAFPNGTDSIIIGCDHGDGIDAAAVLLTQENKILISDADLSKGCPIE
jgi:hypothetical protein